MMGQFLIMQVILRLLPLFMYISGAPIIDVIGSVNVKRKPYMVINIVIAKFNVYIAL